MDYGATNQEWRVDIVYPVFRYDSTNKQNLRQVFLALAGLCIVLFPIQFMFPWMILVVFKYNQKKPGCYNDT